MSTSPRPARGPAVDLNERAVSDAELVVCAKGERQAFGALYARHHERVYRYALSRLSGLSEADAQDIAAEVFLRAMVDLPHYQSRDGASFTAWLYGITRHRIAEELRGRRRRYQLLPTDTPTDAGSEHDPEAQALTELELERAFAVLATLPELERAVMELRFRADQPTERVAELLSTTPKRVKDVVERARARLRGALAGDPIARLDRQALEARRMRAADLFENGQGPNAVAHALGVSKTHAGHWYRAWKAGGVGVLQSKSASMVLARQLWAVATGHPLPAPSRAEREPQVERTPAADRALVVLALLEAASGGPVHVGRLTAVLSDMHRTTLYRALNTAPGRRADRSRQGRLLANHPGPAHRLRRERRGGGCLMILNSTAGVSMAAVQPDAGVRGPSQGRRAVAGDGGQRAAGPRHRRGSAFTVAGCDRDPRHARADELRWRLLAAEVGRRG